jgi:hypothetical protein
MSNDKYLGAILWIGLLLATGLILASLATVGVRGTVVRVPNPGWSGVLITNAVFLWIMAISDYPKMIRNSAILRTVVACWGAFFFLVSLLFAPATRSLAQNGIGYFISAI